MNLPDLSDIHAKIAADLPPLSHLECDECSRRRELAPDDAARFLRCGWPECCGWTMTLVGAKEAAARVVRGDCR
jgi:hypothetical protein